MPDLRRAGISQVIHGQSEAPLRVLVTGGAGFIGSHACVALLAAGHEVVILDNFVNSTASAITRIAQISGKPVAHVCADVRGTALLTKTLVAHRCDAVMHLIGAHESGLIGDSSLGEPSNLMPHLAQAATGQSRQIITTPLTAAASGTTFTWSTWQKAMSRHCTLSIGVMPSGHGT